MANQREEIINIDCLPEEVLCMIFDFLNLKSVKNAAQCCRRWNNIIFFSSYVARFAFKTDLTKPSLEAHRLRDGEPRAKVRRGRKPQMLAQETIRVLTETSRSYCNFKCITNNSMNAHFPSIWQTVHKKFGTNLHSVEICTNDRLTSRTFALFAGTVPSLPKLDSLTLTERFNQLFNLLMMNARLSLRNKNRPLLRSNSVRHLQIESTFKFKPEMPKLQSFDGALFALYRPNDPLAFANLKQLTISVDDMVNPTEATLKAAESTFRSLTQLEIMVWEIEVSHELFIKICETCTSLKELHFISKLNVYSMDMLSLLFNLKDLRSLTFELSCTKYDDAFNFDLSQLPKLKKLCMGEVVIDFLGLPLSTTQLCVSIGDEHYQHVLRKITRPTQLTKLICRFYGSQSDDFEPIRFMQTLPLLSSLKELEFEGGYFNASSFLHLGAPMMNLRTLRFVDCTIDKTIGVFHGLAEKFPNLNQLLLPE